MNIELFRNLTTASWMLSPQALTYALPLLNGILSGFVFDKIEPLSTSYIPVGNSAKIDNATIAVQTIEGVMLKHDQYCGPIGTNTIAKRLAKADANPDVIGHILVFNTGGGASNSVSPIADAIAKSTKPVIALIDGCACSAGIYAASYCNYLIASNAMDMIGCVGTMIEFASFPKKTTLADGRNYVRLYSDLSDEKNKDFEEALAGNFDLIRQNLLNPITELFINEMKSNRPSTTDNQLKGATYFAKDVVGSFIDEVGSMDTAIAKVISMHLDNKEDNTTINNTKMNLPNLNQISSCTDLQLQDGAASLNAEQLTEIDLALAVANTVPGLESQIEILNTTNATHVEIIASRDTTIATRDARIAELEAAIGKPGAAAGSATEINTSETLATEVDATDYCRTYLKNTQ